MKAELIAENIRGAPAILRLTASPLYDEKGQVDGAIESVRDVTRIKKDEVEIVENREKYRLLLQNVSDAVVVHSIVKDSPAPFIEVNDQACLMLGYPKEKLTTLTLADIAHRGRRNLSRLS